MNRTILVAGLAFGLLLLVSVRGAEERQPAAEKTQAAAAAAARLAGEWANTDAATRSLTRLTIAAERNALRIAAWGACEPVECDWGPTALQLLADGESGEFTLAFATWDSPVGTKHLVLKRDGDELSGELFALSRRNPLSSYRETFRVERTSTEAKPEPLKPRRRR